MENQIQKLLCLLNICDQGSIGPFFSKVRDRDDVSVLKCRKSGVIFLSRSDHVQADHYCGQDGFTYWGVADRKAALQLTKEDDDRRASQFQDVIKGRKWLDVGSGLGGILDLLSPIARATLVVEPQTKPREHLAKLGYEVYSDTKDIKDRDVEVVTLFHVLEHLTEPLEVLRVIKERMSPGGKIIIEVPHANDFLITTLNSEAFKAFTFWSEHLILHTRRSLEIFLKKVGFKNIVVSGYQRFSLANHLFWLAHGKPGGHIAWAHLGTPEIGKAYFELLDNLDQTDTLIALADA